MFAGGGILIYSGIKAFEPVDVIKWGLGGEKPKTFLTPGDWKDALGPNEKNPNPGQRYPGDVGLPDPSEEGRTPA
jgi:hypothetical protein